jgi:site-specific DNA-cytosine methylase
MAGNKPARSWVNGYLLIPTFYIILYRCQNGTGEVNMKSLEIFAGGGGLALGVTTAGFAHTSLLEWDTDSAKTLCHNYKQFGFDNEKEWVFNDDIHNISFSDYEDKIDLLSGGPPCQPFSIGGKPPPHFVGSGLCFVKPLSGPPKRRKQPKRYTKRTHTKISCKKPPSMAAALI